MAELTEDRIDNARELLQAGRAEFADAQQARGGAAVVGLRNSCGKGWLATLAAINALFLKQGVAEEELPDTDRGRRYFARRCLDRDLRRAYDGFRNTFHIDGYYEGIVEFDDMPDYFEELVEFINEVAEFPGEAGQSG